MDEFIINNKKIKEINDIDGIWEGLEIILENNESIICKIDNIRHYGKPYGFYIYEDNFDKKKFINSEINKVSIIYNNYDYDNDNDDNDCEITIETSVGNITIILFNEYIGYPSRNISIQIIDKCFLKSF